MTARVKSGAARVRRDPAQQSVRESAPRTIQDPIDAPEEHAAERPRRTILSGPALAAFEAELARELEDAPSIAGHDSEHESPDVPPPVRPAQRRRPSGGKRLEDFLLELQKLAEEAERAEKADAESTRASAIAPAVESVRRTYPRIERTPGGRAPLNRHMHAIQPETVPWIEPPERTSIFVRATRFAAIVFSVIAIVGVSALLVVLAIGDKWTAPEIPKDTARLEQSETARLIPHVPPAQEDAPGSIAPKRDAARIAPGAPAPAFDSAAMDANGAPAGNAPMGGPLVVEQQTAAIGRTVPVTNPPAPEAAAPAAPVAPAPVETGSAQATPPFETNVQAEAAPRAETAVPEANAASGSGVPARAAQPSAAGTPQATPAQATRSAAVKSHVNMRAGPENDAAVVAIVPEGRKVEVVDCERWCEIVYDGKQGFVHRRFVEGAGG